MDVEEFRKEFENLLNELRKKFKDLIMDVERLLDSANVREAYRVWKEGSRSIVKEFREAVERLEKISEGVDEKTLREIINEFRDRIDETIGDISKAFNSILEKVKEIDTSLVISVPGFSRSSKIFIRSFEDIVNSVADIFEDIEEVIEEGLRSIARSRLSNVISARVRRRELELIDQLVDAGIFKSRSEAVAYFVRRGIESSREWIERALEQVKKIKELQDAIRKELHDLDEDGE